MMKSFSFLSLVFLIVSCSRPAQGQAPALSCSLEIYDRPIDGLTDNSVFLLRDTIDLDGKTLALPINVTIKEKGGVIRNGRIVGKNTVIKSNNAIFDKVIVDGTWAVKDISTSLFKDLNYCNSLKDVFALSNGTCPNNIYIAPGDYQLKANKPGDACLRVNDNSKIVLDGNITLQPNDYISYCIIRIEGNNVEICGKGIIKGDRWSHQGKKGEWGMGVAVYESKKVRIRGLTIKDCWGDCIYIAGHSKDVEILRCHLSESRRQGLSITSATNLKIRDCTISDISGTEPQFGIDLEPNKGDTVSHVSIQNTRVSNCKGGIMTFGRAQNAIVKDVSISSCTLINVDSDPIHLNKSENICVEKCAIYSAQDRTINCYEANDILLMNNTIKVKSIFKHNNENFKDFKINKSKVTCKNNKIIYY